MASQPDFAEQKSGVVEVFEKFNIDNGVAYICMFLPKFHPELNFIERCWSQLKYYSKAMSDGTIDTLLRSIGRDRFTAPGPNDEFLVNKDNPEDFLGKAWDFVTITKIRSFSRTCWHYCLAYDQKLSIVEANYFMKKFRQHRCFTKSIDMSIDAYFAGNDEFRNNILSREREGEEEIEIEDADAVQEEIADDYQCDDDAVQADLEEGLDREGILDVDADEADDAHEPDDNVLFDVYRWVETLT